MILANVNSIGHNITQSTQALQVQYSPSFNTSLIAGVVQMMEIGVPGTQVSYGYAANGRFDAYGTNLATGSGKNFRTQFIALGVD